MAVTAGVVAGIAAVACGSFAPGSGDAPAPTPDSALAPADGPRDDGSVADAVAADADGGADAPLDAFDAGCGAVVAIDFTSPTLPGQASTVVDTLGSSLGFDMTGVAGTRAMHVSVPLGATNAVLLVNVQALAADGTLSCNVRCGLDLKLVTRGAAATELVMQGTSLSANLSHSSTFSYFSRTEQGLEAPDLGKIELGTFTHLEIEVAGKSPPFTGTGKIGASAPTVKTLQFLPTSARIGLEKVANDPAVEAIVDNVICRSVLP